MKRPALSKTQRASLLAEYVNPAIRIIDIAKKFGVDPSYVSMLARRARTPMRRRLQKSGEGMSLREEIIAAARQRKTPSEIRKEFSGRASANTISVYLSKYRTMGGIVAAGTLGKFASNGLKTALELEAEQRGVTLHELVDRLLTAIVEDELFDAVLDDRGDDA